MSESLQDRFERWFIPVPESGCWLWTGAYFEKGYGVFRFQYRNYRAHRFAYELYKGQVPNDLFVLHKCDTPECVNPNHLFLGTQTDNIRDAVKKKRMNNSAKTHCKNGHLFSAENTIISPNHRRCRICHYQWTRDRAIR